MNIPGERDRAGAESPATLTGAERLVRACRGLPVDRTPVWLMRQAGRYLPEYKALHERYDFLTLVREPELAATITLQPLRRFPLDGAILFADILLPLVAMGFDLAFVSGEGPRIHNPIRHAQQADQLAVPAVEEELGHVLEAAKLVRRELGDRAALIGFAGAPFTLASYAIEGGGTRTYLHTKRFMWEQPQAWHALMSLLAEVSLRYLRAQVRAGVQVVQLFDSWVGALSPADYREYVLPYSRRVISAVRETGVPVIHFVQQASAMLETVAEAGGDVMGVDWRIDIGEARRRIGPQRAVQGNLDPLTLLAPLPVIERRVAEILAAAGPVGHIMNLGHGVHPQTPVEHVAFFVQTVQRLGARQGGEP